MPTLECLEERSRRILDRLDDLDERWQENYRAIQEALEKGNQKLVSRIDAVEKDVEAIKLKQAEADGKRSVALWLGSTILVVIGALANMLFVWFVGPHGPLTPK